MESKTKDSPTRRSHFTGRKQSYWLAESPAMRPQKARVQILGSSHQVPSLGGQRQIATHLPHGFNAFFEKMEVAVACQVSGTDHVTVKPPKLLHLEKQPIVKVNKTPRSSFPNQYNGVGVGVGRLLETGQARSVGHQHFFAWLLVKQRPRHAT